MQVAFHNKHKTSRSKWSVPQNFPDPAVNHEYMNPKANRSLEKFCWDLPDIGTARLFCRNSMGWTDEFDKLVVPVIERLRERSVQVDNSI